MNSQDTLRLLWSMWEWKYIRQVKLLCCFSLEPVVSALHRSWQHDHSPVLVPGDMKNYLLTSKDCIYSCIVAFSLDVTTEEKTFIFWFNNEAYHAAPLSLSILDNIIYKYLSGPDATITVSNNPQPQRVTKDKSNERYVFVKWDTLNWSSLPASL